MPADQQPQGRAVSSSHGCGGSPWNCQLLSGLNAVHAQLCQVAGIVGSDAVLSAAAVGLVAEVWRYSPVENMHADPRGPSNAAMFAESTALRTVAVAALTVADRSAGLRDFEDHLLDQQRPWAGSGGRTLTDLGQGFLGDYRRHVKERVKALTDLSDHICVPGPLERYLIPKAFMHSRDHKGMPGWPVIVNRIGIPLSFKIV